MRSRAATGLVAAGAVVLVARSSGGYFPSDWGLAMLAFVLAATGAVLLRDTLRVGRSGVVAAGALAALALWQVASSAWAGTAGPPVTEAERTLVYLSATVALLVVLTEETVPALLDGIAAGATVVAVYALGTRLAPGTLGGAYDPSSGYQLAKPLGYWNALGLLVAMGLVLALGAALRGGRAAAALAGAAAVPLVACLYFTFSRGSVVALAVALVVLVALQPARVVAAAHVGALLLAPLVGVALASRSPALTTAGATLQTAQAQGHRLAWQLAVLSLLGAGVAVISAAMLRRVVVPQRAAQVAAVAGVIIVAGVAVAGVAHVGGPYAVVDRARAAFAEEAPATTTGYDRRLLSASGNGRAAYWRVAWSMAERDPLLGSGAGSFARAWARERPVPNEAQDAHNLYLETLAELGLPGLVLLLVALGTPLVVLIRIRASPVAPGAAAALAAYLVHAAVDWDWEIPVLTLVAIACSVSLLVLDPRRREVVLRAPARTAATAALACGIALALVVHVGNRAADASQAALARDDAATAAADARRAQAWMPWSAEGGQLLGEALAEAQRDHAARAALRAAAARDGGDWSIWYDLAAVATGAERAHALTRARELNPSSVEVRALAADVEQRSPAPGGARSG